MRVNVFLNKQHVRDDGTCRVGMYVSANGRGRYMFPFYVRPEDWNDRQRRVKPGHLQHVEYNRAIAAAVSRAEVLALEPGATGSSVVAALARPEVAGTRLGDAIATVLKERASRFKPQTLERLGHIVRLVGDCLPTVTLEGLSAQDVHRYREHVHARGVGQNTLRSRLKLLRLLYKHACSHYGVTVRDVFAGVVPKEIPAEPRFLTAEEIGRLEEWEGSGIEQLARDAFLLALYLGGMRFADLVALERKKVQGPDLVLRQKKTGAVVAITIVPKARAIIDRYEGEKAIPIPTNQQVNEALKRVAHACGINPKVSMHWARHGFAASFTRAGVHVQTISDILGHSNITTTQQYLMHFDRAAADAAFKKVFG